MCSKCMLNENRFEIRKLGKSGKWKLGPWRRTKLVKWVGTVVLQSDFESQNAI